MAAKGQLIKSLNITNAENLEARVRKELEEQGILDPHEEMKDGVENDEILEELVRCQNELKAVSSHNLSQLKRLLKVTQFKACKLLNQPSKFDILHVFKDQNSIIWATGQDFLSDLQKLVA